MFPQIPSSLKPPTYEESRFSDNPGLILKESFSALLDDHQEIQTLFKSVSAQLETTQNIGPGDALCDDWDALRQRHCNLYRNSQHNAGQCSTFMKSYARVLVPLSQSDMSIDEKKLMINKFIESIPIHENAAEKISAQFFRLKNDVEQFPVRIADYLRAKADAVGFWASAWQNVESVCMSVWQSLYRLFHCITNTFLTMLSHINRIRFICGITVDIEMSRMHNIEVGLPSKGQTKTYCKDIQEKLSGFENAWHIIQLSCKNLLQHVEMAGDMTTIPAACDAHLQLGEEVYRPLVECLTAYSINKRLKC